MLRRAPHWLLGLIVILPGVCQLAFAADALPEAGPENGGLRLRWVVSQPENVRRVVYDIRVDLINVSAKPISLRANWELEKDAGDVKQYLEASIGIESFPRFEPWRGGVQGRSIDEKRTSPQPELALKAGETLTFQWRTPGPQLKGHVSDVFRVQNPYFRVPGLYSVHANLAAITADGTFHLRSNEQLVPIGGSRATPKHTYGQLTSVNEAKKTACLDLGERHHVKVGDRFDITSKAYAWRLTITDVHHGLSEGKLESLTKGERQDLPSATAGATLAIEEEKN